MATALRTKIQTTVKKGVLAISTFNRNRKKPLSEPHPYLSGVHTPLTQEMTLTGLNIEGEIPASLTGTYLRIGPNPVTAPNTGDYHWFTGDGMVHGITITPDGTASYRNRWVRSNQVSAALGEIPKPGPRHFRTDNANTNIIEHAGSYWALVEAGAHPIRMDENLETVAHDPFGGTLKGSFTAHPHKDPDSGELHSICYDPGDTDNIRYVRVGTDGKVKRQVLITVEHGPAIHDCMITKNYVIILDLPVVLSIKSTLKGDRFPYLWDDNHKARVGLLPRDGGSDDVIWCDVDPCYVFHPNNGYETPDGRVILDVCAHKSVFRDTDFGPKVESSPFERWVVDPLRKSVERSVLDERSQEFPRHDERFTSKPYRYAYCLGLGDSADRAIGLDGSALFKHDLETGETEDYSFGEGTMCGEFIFVARSIDAVEGDGWLMGLVLDPVNKSSKLYILDATDFSLPPQAAITIPHVIPPGFHGTWAERH